MLHQFRNARKIPASEVIIMAVFILVDIYSSSINIVTGFVVELNSNSATRHTTSSLFPLRYFLVRGMNFHSLDIDSGFLFSNMISNLLTLRIDVIDR